MSFFKDPTFLAIAGGIGGFFLGGPGGSAAGAKTGAAAGGAGAATGAATGAAAGTAAGAGTGAAAGAGTGVTTGAIQGSALAELGPTAFNSLQAAQGLQGVNAAGVGAGAASQGLLGYFRSPEFQKMALKQGFKAGAAPSGGPQPGQVSIAQPTGAQSQPLPTGLGRGDLEEEERLRRFQQSQGAPVGYRRSLFGG